MRTVLKVTEKKAIEAPTKDHLKLLEQQLKQVQSSFELEMEQVQLYARDLNSQVKDLQTKSTKQVEAP